jgi:Holliday junction resolvase
MAVSKGAAFERKCRQTLEDAGWFAVKVSDSARADIVATRREGDRTRTLVVECKAHNRPVRPTQWNQLAQLAEHIGAVPVIADKLPGIVLPQWWRITGPKSGRRGERQPRAPFDIEAWDERRAA